MSEQNSTQSNRVWSGYLLALVLVVWQIKVAGLHGVTDNATLIEYGARKPNFGFPQAPWRLVASMFLHGGWIHLLANVFLVVVWGSQWARLVGAFGLWATFLVSGVWGNLVSDIYGPEALAVGASEALPVWCWRFSAWLSWGRREKAGWVSIDSGCEFQQPWWS